MRSVLTVLCLLATTAHAVPAQFTHQGRLLDVDGVPLEGEATITFRVITEETGGVIVWEEPITVLLNGGFYSAVLGTDEAENPLDVEALSQAPVWLELQLDGEPAMFPRSAINAVPYATMATVAEEVAGGPVDASQIAVDGTPVVNELGEWVGPAPTINWSDIEGMPEDFADGVDDDTDTDTDSFAALGTSCLDGDIAVWDGVAMDWVCDLDRDTLADLACTDGQLIAWSDESTGFVCANDADTVLTADEVDAMVADNGYAMESEVFSSSFLDLTDVPDGLLDGDDDTQLTEDQVDAMVADNGYAMAADAFSGLWSALTGVPDDIADGDQVLTEDEVDAMVADNGYAMAADAFSHLWGDLTGIPEDLADGDDVLTEVEVDAMVADNDFATTSEIFSGEFDDLEGVPASLSEPLVIEPLPASMTDGARNFRNVAWFHEFSPKASGTYRTLQVRTGWAQEGTTLTFAVYEDDSGFPTTRLTQEEWSPTGSDAYKLISIPFNVVLERNRTYHLMVINNGYTDLQANRRTESWVGRHSTAAWTTGPADLSPYATADQYSQMQPMLWFRLL